MWDPQNERKQQIYAAVGRNHQAQRRGEGTQQREKEKNGSSNAPQGNWHSGDKKKRCWSRKKKGDP